MNQGKPGGSSNPSPSATIAFLRGINVGGHHKIPMPALRKAFEAMGFKNVRTVLASGNVREVSGKGRHDPELADLDRARDGPGRTSRMKGESEHGP